MKRTLGFSAAILFALICVTGSLFTSPVSSQTRSATVKALVGGTLIDGYGSKPIRNSVVIIEGERIKAVGQVGSLAIPAGAEVISTEGMSVMPGLWDMHVHLMINGHSDYAHCPRRDILALSCHEGFGPSRHRERMQVRRHHRCAR